MATYIEANSVTLSNVLFSGNANIISLDLRNTPWYNNSMWNAFNSCNNLQSITNINNNVTNMYMAFSNCLSLKNAPEIPSSVQGNNLGRAFEYCTNITTPPTIPNGITSLRQTFMGCWELTTPPVIPQGVTSLYQAFGSCGKLATAPIIPNSVTDMRYAFASCSNLTTAPEIPDSVTTMQQAFSYCRNLTGNIIIHSEKITDAGSCFIWSNDLTKNVYIPFKYENGINTATYDSFVNAGYDEIGTKDGVYLKDIKNLRQQLYAWTCNDCTIYTLTNTPVAYDETCDNNGEDIATATISGTTLNKLRIRAYDSTNNTINIVGTLGA